MLLIGAAYILYLAWKTFRSSSVIEEDGRTGNFFSGLILQFVNPKIYIYCIVSMEAYILPHYHGQWDMLIFFADSCEPSRTYPGVEEIRKAGERDLKNGTLMLLDHVMASLINRKQFLHPKTVAARNYLLKELENNG